MEGFLIAVLSTIIGGLILTFMLFLLNEFAFQITNLSGEWKTIITVQESSYNPFKNLIISYKFHLIQKGYEISGSGEKIEETKGDGSLVKFNRSSRVTVKIEGYYERKWLRRSKIFLNVCEEGKSRETRSTYVLLINESGVLTGNFIWTAGDTKGQVNMSIER